MRKSELIQRGAPAGARYAAYGVLDERQAEVQGKSQGKVIACAGRDSLSLTPASARELAKHLVAAADAVDGGEK